MKLVALALLALSAYAESICGARPTHPHIDYAEAACIDFDALAKLSPFFAGRGKQTQVLIHAKRGDVVAVTVDGVTKYQRLVTDQWGRRVAMATFDGVEYQSVKISVFEAID